MSITFTPLEYRLLKVLVRNPKIVLTRQVLLEKLWDADENFVDEHTLTVTISRIRSKIEADGLQYIKTVYDGLYVDWRAKEMKGLSVNRACSIGVAFLGGILLKAEK